MLAQQGEEFASHAGLETQHLAVSHLGPFAVGARQHEQAVAHAGELHGTEYLHLFAAHHIGHGGQAPVFVEAVQAGHDGDLAGANPGQMLCYFSKAGGASTVGCLDPALAAAGHA